MFEEAIALATRVVDRYAGDPFNAWAVSHGLQARGPAFRLLDGRPAVNGLFEDYAEVYDANGPSYLRFPNKKGDVRVEPHTDQLLKIMTDVGVSPHLPVRVGGQDFTVADLWRGAIARSYLVPKTNHASYGSNDDIGWSLQAIAAWAPPGFQWEALDGTPMSLDFFTSYANAVLHVETRCLAESLASGRPLEKKGQGIFGFICGGAHLLQGTAYAIARGYGTAADRVAMQKQVPLWFHRLVGEVRVYDAALDASPQLRLRIAVQLMAFTGHFLESMHKLAAYGIFIPDEGQRRLMRFSAEQAAGCIVALEKIGAYANMEKIRDKDMQLYLDIVGDSAHALFALELALGRSRIIV